MKRPLTKPQSKVLEFIRGEIASKGYPPTRWEICLKMGWKSPNAATDSLYRLEKGGHIKLIPGISRGVRVL